MSVWIRAHWKPWVTNSLTAHSRGGRDEGVAGQYLAYSFKRDYASDGNMVDRWGESMTIRAIALGTGGSLPIRSKTPIGEVQLDEETKYQREMKYGYREE